MDKPVHHFSKQALYNTRSKEKKKKKNQKRKKDSYLSITQIISMVSGPPTIY